MKIKFKMIVGAISIAFGYSLLAQEPTIIVSEKKVQLTEINEKGSSEAVEGLKQIEGLHYTRRGKSSLDLNIRGLGRDNINILLEGEKAYGACPNRMDPPSSLITLDNLESIEVIKGPYDVKNQGSMGGAVYTKSKEIKSGLESELKIQSGSYDEKILGFRSAYGGEVFKFSVSGSYQGYRPYKDGDGNSITKIYPDLDHPLYYFPLPIPNTININGNNVNLGDLNYEYPGLLPFELITAPSSNRYKYNKRNILTEKKSAGIKTIFVINPEQELEVEGYYFTTNNNLTPYLLMDMVWDEFKRGSIKYSIKNLNQNVKKLSFKIYGNEMLHDMTDELRCSSMSNFTNCTENQLSRSYGMRSWATSSVNGFRIDAETNYFDKTNLGIDSYLRKWNIETTMRMPFPMNVNKDIPPMGMMMPPMPGMGMMMTDYRTQNSIPDTYTTNVGIYIENEKQINKNLIQKSGIRYDIHSTKAKKDRRIVYNIYYPFYDPIYQFKYVSQTEAFTIFDAEVYIPEKELKREYAEGSGYLKWDYEITSELTGKLGLGYGSRFPDPQELYFALFRMGTIQAPDAVGNPTLKPTRNKQLDLGMDLKQEKIRLEVDLFYSALDNYIVIRNSPDHLLGNITRDDLLYHWILQPAMMMMPSYNFYQYVNAIITNYAGILNPMMSMMMPYGRFGKTYKQVDAILYGGEINLKYQLSEEYLAKMGISYSRGINETEDTNLPEIPPLKGLLSIKYIKNQFYVELEGEFAATQNLVDKNIGEKRTPGWGIGNLYAGYELQKDEKQSTKIVAGIKNIFNRYYYEHLSYLRDPYATGMKIPEPGRNVFVQLTMKF